MYYHAPRFVVRRGAYEALEPSLLSLGGIMSDESHRVRIEDIDWYTLFPFLRLFGSFRMAIQPAKMLLALLLVILLYLGGQAMDFIWGAQVSAGEVSHYVNDTPAQFQIWLNQQNSGTSSAGIFATARQYEVRAFDQLISSATAFDFGVRSFLSGRPYKHAGVLGALQTMVIIIPGWLYNNHPGFLAVYLFFAFLLIAILGGAISRLAATQACTGAQISIAQAMHFAAPRYLSFVLAPILPLVVAFVIALLLAATGGLLFNFPVLDIIGSVFFAAMLLGGLIIALLLIGLAVGGNLLYASLAVEGTDAFDVISRAFNYVLGRPWRYLFYSAVMIVYGALTYVFVGLVIFLTLWFTKACVGWWNLRQIVPGTTRFDAILPTPQFGQLTQPVDWSTLQHSHAALIAAWIVMVWVKLLIAILPAFAVSYYFSAHTWIYLLLRRAADGTEFDDMFDKPVQGEPAAPDKIEPTAAHQPADAT